MLNVRETELKTNAYHQTLANKFKRKRKQKQ